jgi:exopolyphosphatase/guanosine-5'-triphosphate,3'-diphosphate pyrophosphatase
MSAEIINFLFKCSCKKDIQIVNIYVISIVSPFFDQEIALQQYATIDIGSNTILLLIGRINSQGKFEVVMDTGETTRLGKGLQAGGMLDPVSVRASIESLKRFCSQCQREGVLEIDAVGTNALRRARDADQFIWQVEQVCGIAPRIISEEEEALLSFLSVQRDPRMPGDAAVMDVGGGSTEFIFRKRAGQSQPLEFISLPLGALRLTEAFLHADPPSDGEIANLGNKINQTLLRIPLPIDGALVGIGGTATTLGSIHLGLDEFDQGRIHRLLLNINDLKTHVKELQQKSLARRKQIKGLPPDRADIILPGALIILSSMERLNKEMIHISSHGLRYGLFYQRFMGIE